MADYFVFYRSFYDAISILDNADSKMRVINAIAAFIFNEEDKSAELTGTEKAIYLMAVPLIEANIRNFERSKRGGAPLGNQNAAGHGAPTGNQNAAGNHGGAPAGNKNAKKTTQTTKQTTQTTNINNNNKNLNLNKNLNKNLNLKEKENKKICDNIYISRIPDFSEIENYISEKNLDVDPAKFFAYYEEKGWDIVSDWKKAIIGWAKKRAEWKKENARSDDEYALLWE